MYKEKIMVSFHNSKVFLLNGYTCSSYKFSIEWLYTNIKNRL